MVHGILVKKISNEKLDEKKNSLLVRPSRN
jgi:hypothetical protein